MRATPTKCVTLDVSFLWMFISDTRAVVVFRMAYWSFSATCSIRLGDYLGKYLRVS